MPIFPLRLSHIGLILATIAVGLLIDVKVGLLGQMALSAVVWAILFFLLAIQDRRTRAPLIACLLIATLGEMFLSLLWGLYTYRLDNIPLFVPPGHVMLFLLGLSLAQRMRPAVADAVIAAAGGYSLWAAFAGVDTLGLALFALLLAASLALPGHRRLYASTFLLALALELLGTGLGNWVWAREVAGLPLLTTNPPLAAGAFYCALDALVVVSMRLFPPARLPTPAPVDTAATCRAGAGSE